MDLGKSRGAELRNEAHKLAASGRHDCTVITKRIQMHQQAAEAYRRSGTAPSLLLHFVL